MANKRPRRLLFVQHFGGLCGAAVSLRGIIRKLDRVRFEPVVLLLQASQEAETFFTDAGAEVVTNSGISFYPHSDVAFLPLRGDRPWEIFTRAIAIPGAVRLAMHAIAALNVDLVHINTSVAIPAGIAAKRLGLPVVWHLRECIKDGILGLRKAVISRVIQENADRILAISNCERDAVGAPHHSQVVYNYVDFSRFDCRKSGQESRRRLGVTGNEPVLLMLGGAVPNKGLRVLIAAMKVLEGHGKRFNLLVAGHPPKVLKSPNRIKRIMRRTAEIAGWFDNASRQCLQALGQLDDPSQVRFLGFRDDVPELLAGSDLLIWPALANHFARPIIEAGAMSTPVLAADFPSSRELVEDGRSGLLVPVDNPRALADAILRLSDDHELAKKMGERGLEIARQRYDAKQNSAAIISVYEELLGVG